MRNIKRYMEHQFDEKLITIMAPHHDMKELIFREIRNKYLIIASNLPTNPIIKSI